jgi:hypothetical protein
MFGIGFQSSSASTQLKPFLMAGGQTRRISGVRHDDHWWLRHRSFGRRDASTTSERERSADTAPAPASVHTGLRASALVAPQPAEE